MELGGADRSAGYLLMEALELLRRCFPVGEGGAERYVALSGKRGLRWILPRESGRLANLLAAWQPYSVPGRVGWGLIRLAAKGRFLSLLPGAESFAVDLSATDWRDYGWTQAEPPAVIAYVGTPGAHRKLVVTLADPRDGAGRLVVKCSLEDTAWAKIEREYTALRELQNELQGIAPRPVRIDRENRFTVQTYLAGRPVGVRLTDAHYRFLAGLYRPESTIFLEEVRERLILRRNRLMERGTLPEERLAHVERLLNEPHWHAKVPGVRIHGDFAPWNLKWSSEGVIHAVDWEDAQSVGLPFYDLHYYAMQAARLLGKKGLVDWGRYASVLVGTGYPKENIEEIQTGCAAQAITMITMLEQTYAKH